MGALHWTALLVSAAHLRAAVTQVHQSSCLQLQLWLWGQAAAQRQTIRWGSVFPVLKQWWLKVGWGTHNVILPCRLR